MADLYVYGLMNRYILFVEKYARFLALVFVLLSVGAFCRVRTLSIESDWGQLFPYPEDVDTVKALSNLSSSSGLTFIFSDQSDRSILRFAETIEAYAALMRETGLFREVLCSYDAGTQSVSPGLWLAFVDPKYLGVLTERLTPPGMDALIGDSVNMLFSPAGSLMTTMLQQDPLQIGRLAVEGVELRSGYHIQDGYLVSADLSELMVIAVPKQNDFMASDLRVLNSLMGQLRKKAAAEQIRCRMPGSIFLRAELYTSVQQDIVKSASISLVAVVIFFCLVFRGAVRIVCCMMLPLIFSLLVTFALYSFYSLAIDLITAMSAVMLIGLGVDFGIHLMMRYLWESGARHNRLLCALSGTGKGILSSALTTATAFLSILFTGMKSFYLLGITAGVGILLALTAFFLVFPVCIVLLKPERHYKSTGMNWVAVGIQHLQPLRWVLIVFLVAGSFFLPRLHFVSDYRMFLPEHSKVMQDMHDSLDTASSDTADALIVRVASKGYRSDAMLIEKMTNSFSNAAWKTPYILLPSWQDIHTLRTGLVEFCAQQHVTPETTKQHLRSSYALHQLHYPETLDAYVDNVFAAWAPGYWEQLLYAIPLVSPFFTEDKQHLLLMAIQENGRPWTVDEVNRMDAIINNHDLEGECMSTELLLDKVRERCIPESAWALIITLVIILGIMWFHFHNVRYILLVLIPLVCGMWMTCVIMALFDTPFNFFNLPVIPLIFGLGIDDGIHFMQAVKEYKSVSKALQDTGSAIVLTTVTTCLGFGALILVSFPGIALMGLMLVTGLVCCLLATVMILPALCRNIDC